MIVLNLLYLDAMSCPLVPMFLRNLLSQASSSILKMEIHTNQPYYMASNPRIQYLKLSHSYASSKLKPHPILASVLIFPHSAVNPVL
jgi:hypothetical protein